MAKNIKRYVKDCKTCNCKKAARHKPYKLLQLLLALSGPWKDNTIDFMTSVIPSLRLDRKAYDAILVVVDWYTKLAKYYPILKMITAEQLSNLLIHTCEDLMPGDVRTPQRPSDWPKRVKRAQQGSGSDKETPGQPNSWARAKTI